MQSSRFGLIKNNNKKAMKKNYLFIFMGLLISAFQANAQEIYLEHFEDTDPAFISSSVLMSGQNESDYIIYSQGHGEWDQATYGINVDGDSSTFAMTSSDTVYVRAKASYTSDAAPVLDFKIFDNTGVGPNNATYQSVNRLTLSEEWTVFKFAVSNWENTWGDGSMTDTNNIASFGFSPNNAFASYPYANAEGDTINAAFQGSIYIDYIAVGSNLSIENGTDLPTVTSYLHEFTEDNIANITSGPSFTNSVDGGLLIESLGHGEWETITVPFDDVVVDVSDTLLLSFIASADITDGSELAFMIVAVDEIGTRIQSPDLFTYQSLTSESQTYSVSLNEFYYVTDGSVAVNAERIVAFEILINPGFSSYPVTNSVDSTVNTAFQGSILIEGIQLDESVIISVEGDYETLGLDFFPNPANNVIVIADEALANANFEITDLNGVVVSSGVISGQTIDINDIATGAYIVTATANERIYRSTLIVE